MATDLDELERAADDWTAVPCGPSNTSPEFERLVGEVDRLIRQSGHALIAGGSRSVAGLVMAQLAHVHGLMPRAGVRDAIGELAAARRVLAEAESVRAFLPLPVARALEDYLDSYGATL